MEIQQLFTPYNRTITDSTDRIKYIVIHYVGATGGAKANCNYYASRYIGASAHYFVGFDGEIWQSVEDKDIAWHCGAKVYVHPECRNANSIGIEMCVRNRGGQSDTSRDWYFEASTVASAIALTKQLMKKYQIPQDHVLRHYDVTGKICPNPYVFNHTVHTWAEFRQKIAQPESGWVTDGLGLRYLHKDGSYMTNNWEKIDEKWYWFDGAGHAVSNTWKAGKDGKWYYLGNDSSMVSNCVIAVGKEVFAFGPGGAMLTGNVTLRTDHRGALTVEQ